MIEVQLYRLRVGIFLARNHLSKRYFSRKHSSKHKTSRNGDSYLVKFFFRMIVLISLLVLTSEVNLHHLHDAEITRSLELSGDVELNPGPFGIVRTAQGSSNQGNLALFGETAGRQCACNALLSICWSHVREISFWRTIDLDFILVEGDKLYKYLNFQGYLNVAQQPQEVQIFRHTVNLKILAENLHNGIAVFGDSFLNDIFDTSNANNSSGCILFLCSYAVAMFKHVNGAGNVSYFVFDSHCRNSRAITCSTR